MFCLFQKELTAQTIEDHDRSERVVVRVGRSEAELRRFYL